MAFMELVFAVLTVKWGYPPQAQLHDLSSIPRGKPKFPGEEGLVLPDEDYEAYLARAAGYMRLCRLVGVQLLEEEFIVIMALEPKALREHVLTVPAQVRHHTIHLLLLRQMYCDAAKSHISCLAQPAVGPGRTEQAALVVCCKVLQCQQQAGVWQLYQRERLCTCHPARVAPGQQLCSSAGKNMLQLLRDGRHVDG
jgi:hypothetical protein